MKDLLMKWEAPQPDPSLDQRIWASYRRLKRRWIAAPVGIAAALTLAIALWHRSAAGNVESDSQVIATPSSVTVETQFNVSGFQPLRDAKLMKEVQ